jgi:hypothetical protein
VSEEVRLVPVSNAIDNGKKFAVHQLRNWGIIAASLALMASFSLAKPARSSGPGRRPRSCRGRPVYPGEYAFLGTAWPEMATFLTTHGL